MQRFINTFCGGSHQENARKYQQQPKSPSNASIGKGSFFICLDEASSVCNPKELSHDSSNKARIFTIAEHAKRVKLLRAKRELRLRRVSKSDAFKEATRTYETFGLGAFATWVSTEHAISAVSDDEVTVMFCGDFCVPNLHTLDDMHSAFVRFVFFFFLFFFVFFVCNVRARGKEVHRWCM